MKRNTIFLPLLILVFLLFSSSCLYSETITITQIKTDTTTITTTLSASTITAKTPKIYELRMYGVSGETNAIIIPTSIGDRVSCEVTTAINWLNCFVYIRDIYGNTIAESSKTTIVHIEEGQSYPWGKQDPPYLVTTIMSNQKYPWTYSFYATTNKYILAVIGVGYSDGEISAYAKVTVY